MDSCFRRNDGGSYVEFTLLLENRLTFKLYLSRMMSKFVSERVFVFLTLLLCLEIFLHLSETNLQASDVCPPEVNKDRVWVFFTDKGTSHESNSRSAIARYASQLPSRTRSRRQKAQGRVIDILDLPVHQPYIDTVIQFGATLRITSRWLNGITVEAPGDVIPQILQLPYIKSIEPVATYKRQQHKPQRAYRAPGASTTDIETNRAAEEYGMSSTQIQQIHVDALHEKGYHGEGITIALLDTGFDLSHEALRNVRVLGEYDFVNGDGETSDNPPEDDIGQDDHGTEILSIIAGNSQKNLIGVAYAAQYLLAKTEKISHEGIMFEQEIEEDWWVAGIEWAELNGADVVSSSLGYSDWYSYSDIDGATAKTTIAANIAVEKGVVVVVSVGNEGKSRDWPYISAPADGFDVIAVGAVDHKGEIADFSSIGPTYDGRIKPDVVAMGDGTYVVDPNSTDGYRKADGTSMATPLVAGTIAILLQALNSYELLDGELYKPRDLVKVLKYTATRARYPDNHYGWGIVNAEAAFQYVISPQLMGKIKDWDTTGTNSNSRQVIVYPNPVRRNSAMSRLNIHNPEYIKSIKIYSILGSLIYKREDIDNARLSIWNLKNNFGEEVANGIYICVIEGSTGIIDVKKIAVID